MGNFKGQVFLRTTSAPPPAVGAKGGSDESFPLPGGAKNVWQAPDPSRFRDVQAVGGPGGWWFERGRGSRAEPLAETKRDNVGRGLESRSRKPVTKRPIVSIT